MTGQNDNPENRATADAEARRRYAIPEHTTDFDLLNLETEAVYSKGFQDGSIWLADHVEPSRASVSTSALAVTWQTLVIFRDIAIEQSDFERVSYLSASIRDIATMIHEQGEDVPEIHDDRVPTADAEGEVLA